MSILRPLIDRIERDIDEATAENQRQLDTLVEALREAQTCLLMEGYGSSRDRRGHAVMGQISEALAPFPEGGTHG